MKEIKSYTFAELAEEYKVSTKTLCNWKLPIH